MTCRTARRRRRYAGSEIGWAEIPSSILCLSALVAVLFLPSTSIAQLLLPCGDPISGDLAVGATDSYSFAPAAGTAVVVQASSLSDDLGLLRLRANGSGVSEDSCSSVLNFVSKGGSIRISVSPCLAGSSGSYTLTLQVVSAGSANCGALLPCGLTPLGTALSVPGEVDSYRFTAIAGARVHLGVVDAEGVEDAYRLRLYDPSGAEMGSGTCSDEVAVAVPASGDYTLLLSSCVGLRTSGYRIERSDAQCPRGPEITYFGLLPQNQQISVSTTFDALGRPIYFGQRGVLVVEARAGETGSTVGNLAYEPGALPDLQVIVDRPLGNGSAAVCDLNPPGGVPASQPFAFSTDAAAIGRVNDLGCRVDDGMSRPVGHRSSLDACPRDSNGSPSFVSKDTTVEFCLPVSTSLAFAPGDTVVKARVRDQSGVLGAEREIVVRVATPRLTPTPSATRTLTSSATPTPTPRTPATPIIRTPGPCTGDCNENGSVSVAELTRAVRIALESLGIAACPLADSDASGAVDISDLIGAVANALHGCPPAPAA